MLSCGYERISGQGPMDLWMMQFRIHWRSLFFLKSIHQTSPIVFLVTWTKCGSFFCQKDMTAGFCMLGFKIDTLEYL